MRAVVYLRQSLDRAGTGAAVDRQREDCLKLCAERGWEVVGEFADNDTSASSKKPRPQYQAMLAAVEAGGVEIVVAWHVDRLTRKLTDLEHLIEVAQRTGVRIATVTGDLDLSTDAGRLVGRILASVARGEVERKGARQKRAQQQAAAQGRPSGGQRPFGYASDGITIVDHEAAAIREAYAELLRGGSLKGIAKRWNEAKLFTTSGNPWTHTTVRRMLQNPRYAGLRAYRGAVVGPAVWEALVDAETHEAAVALLSAPDRRTTTSTTLKYLLPSIALCWKCGSDVATGHSRHGQRLYVCRANKCVSRKAQPVDDLIEAVVIERLSRPDALDLVATEPRDVTALRVQRDAIQGRLDDLAVGLEEGILTLGAVRKSSVRLRKELETVEAEISASVHVDALTPLVHSSDVAAAWAGLDLQQKRAVIADLMTITLLAPERGHQPFTPDRVKIEWKTA